MGSIWGSEMYTPSNKQMFNWADRNSGKHGKAGDDKINKSELKATLARANKDGSVQSRQKLNKVLAQFDRYQKGGCINFYAFDKLAGK
jgi:hypothetical protein